MKTYTLLNTRLSTILGVADSKDELERGDCVLPFQLISL
jgi:hypothetical protein